MEPTNGVSYSIEQATILLTTTKNILTHYFLKLNSDEVGGARNR